MKNIVIIVDSVSVWVPIELMTEKAFDSLWKQYHSRKDKRFNENHDINEYLVFSKSCLGNIERAVKEYSRSPKKEYSISIKY